MSCALQLLTLATLLSADYISAQAPSVPTHLPQASTVVMNRKSARSFDFSVSVEGAKKLYLVVTPTEKSLPENPVAWLEPRLVGPAGAKKLTDLTPVATLNERGPVALHQTMAGRPFRYLGQHVEYGFGVRGPSVLVFDVPEGYAQFLTTVSVDSMNPQDQEVKGSVRCKIFTDVPGTASQQPELDRAEAAKAAAEQERTLRKAKDDVAEALKRYQKATERLDKEKQRFDEEAKRYEEVLKKYPDLKPPQP